MMSRSAAASASASPRRRQGHHVDLRSASPNPSPARQQPWHRQLEVSMGLLEPGSTPRPRSRTRPAGSFGSPSPIQHGPFFRSTEMSTSLSPFASVAEQTAGLNGVASRQRVGGGLPQEEYDAMLAEVDRQRRRGQRGQPTPTHRRASLSQPLGASVGSSTAGTSLSHLRPPEDQWSGASPLAVALRAQWTLLLQGQQQPPPRHGGQAGAAAGQSPSLLAASEKDLLRVLGALPTYEESALAREAHMIAPYLLAFAVTPVPSLKTQAVALAALHGVVVSLPARLGRDAATALLSDWFMGEKEGLAAFDLAFARVLREQAADADDPAVKSGVGPRGNGRSAGGHALPAVELRRAVTDSILDILFDLSVVSSAAASSILAQDQLVRNLLRYLPEATPTQAETIAGLLQAVLEAPEGSGWPEDPPADPPLPSSAVRRGRRKMGGAERAAILAGYGAHHVVLRCIRACVRETYNGRGNLAANATVTTLCALLRVAVRLVAAPAVFEVMAEDDALSTLLAQLLTLPWGDVVELACLWVVALLARLPLKGGPTFARNLLAKGEPVQVLTRLLGWRDRGTFSYATSAALCWRWLCLSSGSGTHGAPAAEVMVAEPGVLLSFVHAILTNPLPPPPPSLSSSRAEAEEGAPSRREWRDKALFACELVLGVAAAFLTGTEYTRAAMQQSLQASLTPELLGALRDSVRDALQCLSESYFEGFPALILEDGTELSAAIAPSAGGGRILGQRARRRTSSGRREHADSAASSRASSASSAYSQTHRNYESKFMNQRRRRSGSVNGDHADREGGMEGGKECPEDHQEGPPAMVVSTGGQWRAAVLCSWEALCSGLSSAGPAAARGRGGGGSGGAALLDSVPRRPSLLRSPTRSAMPQGFLSGIGLQLQRTPAPTPTAAVAGDPQRGSPPPSPRKQMNERTAVSLGRQERRPLPDYLHWDVVQRATLLADGGALYRDSIRSVLRLAHRYAEAGVVGEAQLPLTSRSTLGQDGEAVGERERMRQYRASTFSLLLEEKPQYSPLVAVALSASAEPRGSAPGRRRSSSVGSHVSANAPRRSSRDEVGGQLSSRRNPWAPPAKVSSSRRWHVRDLQRSDVLLFAIAYERLVPDLATAISAVEAHIRALHQQLQVLPMKETMRHLVLNDLYTNVYPKVHLFLRYVQRQVGRSRAALQLLSEAQDSGEVCIHSGSIVDVYDAIGHCAGDA